MAFGNGLSSGYAGVYVAGAGNTIGGTVSGAGNVIAASGSYGVRLDTAAATGNLVAGNEIGTNAAGTAALPNAYDGILINLGSTNTIGGTTATAGNLISGNRLGGIAINGNDNLVEANLVGTNGGGTSALANGGTGVTIYAGGSGNTIGGTTTATANVLSGNTGYGLQVDGSTTTGDIVANNWVGTGSGGSGSVPNGGGAMEITNSAAVLAAAALTATSSMTARSASGTHQVSLQSTGATRRAPPERSTWTWAERRLRSTTSSKSPAPRRSRAP